MPLTAAQLTALKNDMAANTATIPAGQPWTNGYAGVQVKNVPAAAGGNDTIAGWYNQQAVADFWGNYKNVPIDAIKGSITHKNYTPNDQPPASGSTTQVTNDQLLALNRMLFASMFQMSLNNLLLGGGSFDATNATLVAALKDATNSDMPTGTSGALRKGGWTTVQTVICRRGTYAEKLFADTSGANGAANTTAATFTFEGSLAGNDVDAARNS